MRPWLEAANARAEYGPLFALTRALHRRAWDVAELQEMLARAVGAGNTGWAAQQAIDLWLADPAHRWDRVAAGAGRGRVGGGAAPGVADALRKPD